MFFIYRFSILCIVLTFVGGMRAYNPNSLAKTLQTERDRVMLCERDGKTEIER